MVGTSGMASERFAEVTAMGCMRPLATYGAPARAFGHGERG